MRITAERTGLVRSGPLSTTTSEYGESGGSSLLRKEDRFGYTRVIEDRLFGYRDPKLFGC